MGRSLSSLITLARVALVEKKLTTEYSQNESSYILHRNHKFYGNHDQKPYNYILLATNVFSHYAYALPLCTKGGPEVARALQANFEQDFYRKIQTDWGREFVIPPVKKGLLKYNTMLDHSDSTII